MFGDGKLAACKPISESDLASFIADCVAQKDKVGSFWDLQWTEGGTLDKKRSAFSTVA
jgi:hypothetical protein